jgi:predicted metal-dependent hydrolase
MLNLKPRKMRTEEHQKFLIEQYNRNRPAEKQVTDMGELNRALLTTEIKYVGRNVTLSERRVFHKYGEITINIPKDIPQDDVHQWLMDNEHTWEKDLDKALAESNYEFGFGFEDRRGMEEHDQPTESRYDINGENYGGHL